MRSSGCFFERSCSSRRVSSATVTNSWVVTAEALGFSVQRLVVLLAPEVIGVGALGGLRLQRPLASFSSGSV